MTNHLNHAHCVMHERYHTQVVALQGMHQIFRLGHFSLMWPDPIWYHYTDKYWCVVCEGGGIHKCRYKYC